jgi:hypothetical protein
MISNIQYNKNTIPYNLFTKLRNKLTLSDTTLSSNREEIFLKDICNRVQKSKTVLYTLKDDDNIVGLISLSVTSITEQPSLQIDYILVNKIYQGKILEDLDDTKPFRYMIEFAIDLAKDLQSKIGLRYIVLSPDNDDIKAKYKQVGFEILHDDWMYLKI